MPYYVNPASTYAIAIIFPVLCTVLVVLRFLARRRMNVGYGPDDWVSVAALIFTIGCAIVLIVGALEPFFLWKLQTDHVSGDANETIGWHSPPQTAEESFGKSTQLLTLNAKLQYAFFPLMVSAIGLIRLTICLLYRRIFRGKIFSIINWTIIGLIIAWMVTFTFATLFQCAPNFTSFWGSQADFARDCPGDFMINSGLSLSDVIIDIMILILPVKPVIDLNMDKKRKFLVLIVFALGIFSIAAGMTRMVLLMLVLTYDYGSNDTLFGLSGTSDPLGVVGTALWWSFMEIGVGCLVSNMPAVIGYFRGGRLSPLKSLIDRISLKSFTSFTGGSVRNQSTGDEDSEELKPRSHGSSQTRTYYAEAAKTEEGYGPTDPRW